MGDCMRLFFISFQSESEVFALEMQNRLESEGLVTWMFRRDLTVGDAWKQVIDNAIIESVAVIVIVTFKALQSQYVTYEWSFALGKDKRVIPFILERPDPANPSHPPMHPKLQDYQYAGYTLKTFSWESFIEELKLLLRQEERPPEIVNAENDLASSNPDVRKHGIEALKINEHTAASAGLVRALASQYPDVKVYAALALAEKTNYKDERVLPGLSKALDRNDTFDRSLLALGNIGTSGAVAIMADGIERLSDYRREKLILALAQIKDKSAIPELRKLLKSETLYFAVIDALGAFGDPQVLPDLIEYLTSLGVDEHKAELRERLIRAIAEIGNSDAVDALYNVLWELAPHYIGVNQYLFDLSVDRLMYIGDTNSIRVLENASKEKRFGGFELTFRNAISQITRNLK